MLNENAEAASRNCATITVTKITPQIMVNISDDRQRTSKSLENTNPVVNGYYGRNLMIACELPLEVDAVADEGAISIVVPLRHAVQWFGCFLSSKGSPKKKRGSIQDVPQI
jgi:spermidine/putrescine-binding protein